MKKDIPKRKTSFFFILKMPSNKQQLFFYFIGTLKVRVSLLGTLVSLNSTPVNLN